MRNGTGCSPGKPAIRLGRRGHAAKLDRTKSRHCGFSFAARAQMTDDGNWQGLPASVKATCSKRTVRGPGYTKGPSHAFDWALPLQMLKWILPGSTGNGALPSFLTS